MEPLVSLIIALGAAGLTGELFSRFKMPRGIGEISAGLILGLPFFRELFFDSKGISLLSYFSDIGAILLLFFAGLKVNLKAFVKNFRVASGISFGNTTLPLFFGFLASRYIFGLGTGESLIVGIGLSVSAIALSLDVLEEFDMLKTKFGSLVISAGAVDDVYELGLITIAISFIEAIALKAKLLGLLQNAVLFAGAVLLFRFAIVPLVLGVVEKRTETTLLMSGLILTLIMAALSKLLGFGTLTGAIISGMIIRQTLLRDVVHHRPWEAGHVSRNIHIIAFGFFVPLFFFYAGFITNLSLILKNIVFSIAITLIAIAGTVLGSALAYYLQTKEWGEGVLLGWALNSKGDTEIVISTLALSAGAISQEIFSSLIFMAVISTLVSPIVFRYMLKKRMKK